MAAPKWDETEAAGPSFEETQPLHPADESVWAKGKQLLADPGKYLDDRKAAFHEVEQLMAERDAARKDAPLFGPRTGNEPEPIENFGTTGALPLAAVSGGRGMMTTRTAPAAAGFAQGEWATAVPDVISSAGHQGKVSALANRVPLEKAVGLMRDSYNAAKPYLKGGAGLYIAKKLGLLN